MVCVTVGSHMVSKQAFYEKFLENFKASGRSPGSRVYEQFFINF